MIAIVGGGAIGLLIAGRLAQKGLPVLLIARPDVCAAIARDGVRVEEENDLAVVPDLRALERPPAAGERGHRPELAILCVKSYATAEALPTLAALEPRSILTLQNGIGNEELLAERFGADAIVAGAITASVEVTAAGQVRVVKAGAIGVAPVGRSHAPATRAAELLAAAFTTRSYADYRSLTWSTALLSMIGSATGAILDMPVGDVYADRRLRAIERRALMEALRVMERLGVRAVNLPSYPAALLAWGLRLTPPALLEELLRRAVADGRGGRLTSLQLDLRAGRRRSEGEFLYGAVARAGAANGVPTPVNGALWETLRRVACGETAWDAFRGRPEALIRAIDG